MQMPVVQFLGFLLSAQYNGAEQNFTCTNSFGSCSNQDSFHSE